MENITLPKDSAHKWEVLLLIMSSEEKKINRTNEGEIDTMNYFYKNQGVRQIVNYWLSEMQTSHAEKTTFDDSPIKNNDVSIYWRKHGNDKFVANQFEESFMCYCKSVLFAEPGSTPYGLSLANRSATLIKMKKFRECLKDIEMAFENNYPHKLHYKLYLRRAECYAKTGEKEALIESLNNAKSYALNILLAPTTAVEFDRAVKVLEAKLEDWNVVPDDEEIGPPPLHKGENRNFIAASSALELKRNELSGRYVIAREPTQRGDILFSEEPYAWVTLPVSDTSRYSCETCCKFEINPLPCETCSRTTFCSVECRTRGQELFHRWECQGVQANIFHTIGIAHLALRVLLSAAHEGFPRLANSDVEPTTAAELFAAYSQLDNIEIYKTNVPPFYRMFNLTSNLDKMTNADYIQYAITATMMVMYLEQRTTFFEYLASRMPYSLRSSQRRLFAGSLLFRALGQLVCNGHAALTLALWQDPDEGRGLTVTERELRRATAIYPSAAMMNHSCEPNIINTFYKGRLVVVCSKEVSAGGEVSNCYGPHRSREPLHRRKAALRAQYMFNCICSGCCDPRPDFVNLFTAYSCQSCRGPVICTAVPGGSEPRCPICSAVFRVDRAVETLEHAKELIAQSNVAPTPQETCDKAQAAYKLQQMVWHRHHKCLRQSADRLARLYTEFCDFNRAIELLKQNIQSIEYQYGSFSAEVAHELRKLAEVMLERLHSNPLCPEFRVWCLETLKITKKAKQMTELNYGRWEPLVKKLAEDEKYVAAMVTDNTATDTDSVHQNFHYNLKI